MKFLKTLNSLYHTPLSLMQFLKIETTTHGYVGKVHMELVKNWGNETLVFLQGFWSMCLILMYLTTIYVHHDVT
jgi:hypothetical protein